MKFGLYSSVCNVCYQKGYHEKQTKCLREISVPCKCCGSREYATMKKCTGQNIIINYSECPQKFIPYYENGQRVKIKFHYGKTIEIKSGRIGITTGWKPVFILLARSNSTGSSDILREKDEVVY